jgi:hypothetical protein
MAVLAGAALFRIKLGTFLLPNFVLIFNGTFSDVTWMIGSTSNVLNGMV